MRQHIVQCMGCVSRAEADRLAYLDFDTDLTLAFVFAHLCKFVYAATYHCIVVRIPVGCTTAVG
jgi:hypothetical protein